MGKENILLRSSFIQRTQRWESTSLERPWILETGEVHKLFLAPAIFQLVSSPEATATPLPLTCGQVITEAVGKASAEIGPPEVDHPNAWSYVLRVFYWIWILRYWVWCILVYKPHPDSGMFSYNRSPYSSPLTSQTWLAGVCGSSVEVTSLWSLPTLFGQPQHALEFRLLIKLMRLSVGKNCKSINSYTATTKTAALSPRNCFYIVQISFAN